MYSVYIEGDADKKFIQDLISCIFGKELVHVQYYKLDGFTNLPSYKNTIRATLDLGGKNIFIVDADDDLKDKEDKIHEIDEEASCFFIPNNEDSGCLEDLLNRIIAEKHAIVFECFERYQKCLDTNGDYCLPNNKAKIYAYCEAILGGKSKKIKERERDYLDMELWDLSNDYLIPLKEFIKLEIE